VKAARRIRSLARLGHARRFPSLPTPELGPPRRTSRGIPLIQTRPRAGGVRPSYLGWISAAVDKKVDAPEPGAVVWRSIAA
jgi:hypothetical protein